jgi:hypothetical protein
MRPSPGQSYQLPPVADHPATAQSQPGLVLPGSVGRSLSRRQPRHSCSSPYTATLSPRPSEPILVPKLRIRFADFPYLHCSTDQRLFTLETCCGYGYGLERESLASSRDTTPAYITHSHFQGPPRALRTPQEPWCFWQPASLPLGEPLPGTRLLLQRKDNSSRGPCRRLRVCFCCQFRCYPAR